MLEELRIQRSRLPTRLSQVYRGYGIAFEGDHDSSLPGEGILGGRDPKTGT